MISGIGRRALTSAFCLLTLAAASVANAQQINEFQPNPPGTDPNPGSLELLGTPSTAFSGVLIARETDDAAGNINNVEAVAGMFDANGILSLSIADLENPSFDLILVDAFTGTAGVDTINSMADLMALGTTTVFDAIGIIDTPGDGANSIAVTLGGTLIAYTGDEPQAVFRDSANPSTLVAINDPANADAFDQDGNAIPLATGFADAGGTPIDLTAGPFTTFGAANYQITAVIDPVGSCSGLTPAPACIETTQSDCTTLGGTFVEGGNCPTGACDDGMGGCTIETEDACLMAGGTYNGDGSACPVVGSCSGLMSAPACVQSTDVDCAMLGGMFTADGMCPTGACTVGMICTVETEEDCVNNAGTYDGDGTTCPGLMSDTLINEFQPNPPGADPAMVDFELRGPANTFFSGWILSVDTDDGVGALVDRAFPVSGNFDADGILNLSIPDLENPSFTVFLVDNFNGDIMNTGGSGVEVLDSVDDLAGLGITVLYDVITINDTAADEANSIADELGGTNFPFTGDEPQLAFRDSVDPSIIYAINDPADGEAFDQLGNTYNLATDFSLLDGIPVDLTIPTPTFGSINYTTLVADPRGACSGQMGTPSCTLETEADCMTLGGMFAGGETCPTGACNFMDDTCVILTEEACLDQGGMYAGDGAECVGACCDFATNECTPNVTEVSCIEVSGLYLGDNSDCSGGCPTIIPEGIVLNEIRLDQGGADGDYIELAGPAGTDLSGLQIVVLGDPGSGNVDRVISLFGQTMGMDGIFLIADATNVNVVPNDGIDLDIGGFSLENGDNLTFLLVFGFGGVAGDDLDSLDDCLLDTPEPWVAELDRVALIVRPNSDLGFEPCHYATVPGMGGGGMGCPDCLGDFDNSGTRDLGDVMGFVNALLNTGDVCADINADTFVDGLDIDGFTQLVIGQEACPGGVMAVDVPSQIVGPDGAFVPAHAFRLPNETGAWRQGEFNPANSLDTAGTPNVAPDGACCTTMGCVISNTFDCTDSGGLFRGDGTTCMDAGICDAQGISSTEGPDAVGLGFIIGPVVVVETVDNDSNTNDDRVFTVQDESGFPIGPAGTTRGLSIVFNELDNPAVGTLVDTLSEGDCINVSGTTEDIAGGRFLRIDEVSDIVTGQVGCSAINVPVVSSTDFTGGTPESEALSSVRVQLDCSLFLASGSFANDTSYDVTDGGPATVSVRVNSAAGAAMPIIGSMIPSTTAVRIEGIYSLSFGPQLRLHESDDLLTTNCFFDLNACCLNDGTCLDVSSSICSSLGGTTEFGMTCATVSCPDTTNPQGLIACDSGVDCTVGDMNGFCYFQIDNGSSITANGCGAFAFPSQSFEVACPSTCDAIGSTVVFQIPANGISAGVPAADCIVLADLFDASFNGLPDCDASGLAGPIPTFELAP